MRTLACILLAALAAAQTHDRKPRVRFHHLHQRVDDPAAAMNASAKALTGVRAIAPGLGVGVRVGDVYLLFERLDETDRRGAAQMDIGKAVTHAAEWLRAHGVEADPSGWERVTSATSPEAYHHVAFAAPELAAAVAQVERGGARGVKRTPDSVLFDTGRGLLVELVADDDRPDAFWCPMHPDMRSADARTCDLCGMTLVPIPPPKIGEYRLDVALERAPKQAGLDGLRFIVREPDSNAAVQRFITVHERTFHLFVISRDLAYFEHLHPEAQADGSFVLRHQLPPGEYMLIADFLPHGGTLQMVQKAIVSPGVPLRRKASAAAVPPDVRQVKVGGLVVSLETGPAVAGKDALLTFSVRDAETGLPITDLQPYLGAPAHMLIVRSDLTDAIHAHPEEQATGGPTVSFHPLIPAPGDYRIWIQFQRAGKVITASFAIRAEQ